VRPLYDDGASKAQEATRDYVLKVDGNAESGAIINVFGGKITTYRRLAESVMEKVEEALGARRPAWTSGATLPGGDFPVDGFESLVAILKAEAPSIAEKTIRRLARNYGTLTRRILGSDRRLGRVFGADLGEKEVDYLIGEEWARSPEDILWRRSKLGLKFSADEVAALASHMNARNTARDQAGRTTIQ
jgi:glycerol-3-phosphate dehydrogenase